MKNELETASILHIQVPGNGTEMAVACAGLLAVRNSLEILSHENRY
jgi:hypothetical protein